MSLQINNFLKVTNNYSNMFLMREGGGGVGEFLHKNIQRKIIKTLLKKWRENLLLAIVWIMIGIELKFV